MKIPDNEDFPPKVIPGILFGILFWGIVVSAVLHFFGILRTTCIVVFIICSVTIIIVGLVKWLGRSVTRFMNTYDDK